MGEDNESDKDTLSEDDRSRTPVITGPVIELRGREVVFAICVFFLSAIVVGLIVVLASNKVKETEDEHTLQASRCHKQTVKYQEESAKNAKSAEAERRKYCLTPHCVHTASRILRNMDRTISPCNDFFRYACGGWLKEHVDKYDDDYGVDVLARNNVNEKLRSIIAHGRVGASAGVGVKGAGNSATADNSGQQNSFQWKIQTLYSRCMDHENAGKDGDSGFDRILEDFGGWSVFDEWNVDVTKDRLWQTQKVLEKLQFKYNIASLFNVDVVSVEEGNETSKYIQIKGLRQTDWNLPKHSDYSRSDTDIMIVAYKKFMTSFARKRNVTANKTDEFVRNTLNFERKLAMVHESQNETADDEPIPIRSITVDQLQQLCIHSSCKIKWVQYLSHVMKNVAKNTTVLISNTSFIPTLFELIGKTEENDMNSYLVWRLMSRLTAPLMSADYRQAYDVYQKVVYDNNSTRQDFCQKVVEKYFGKGLRAMYLWNHLSNTSAVKVKSMLASTKKAFARTLSLCHWMDDATRETAKGKLEAMKFIVGGPDVLYNESYINDYYENLEVNANSTFFQIILNSIKHQLEKTKESYENAADSIWLVNPHDVQVSYYPAKNLIGITAGMIGEPYFDPDVPVMLNYGSLGSIIAHEMTHAFDETGADYDKDGVRAMWWTDDTWDKFHRETYCIGDYYGKLKVNCQRISGQRTKNENIADIGGLRLAYKAYLHWKHENDAAEGQQLPLKNITSDQFFFVAFAQNYCKKRGHENLKKYLKTSSCSPEQIRVAGSVSHLEEFAKTFNCERDTKMNPINKCLIW